ncbi:hypothetical protein VSA01S_24380 [Vibrio sagamiensis NBRC 104589]|uniref:Uncharacterized protein n=1 Tax=Vibrio sagamiensis NBRC 104589 TaxID=1219064 RepID=A0A511QGP6_9VIBR|nr:hypothetical protein VSA01S_24380 [Vibrio sagamiensis NBRC 104589]
MTPILCCVATVGLGSGALDISGGGGGGGGAIDGFGGGGGGGGGGATSADEGVKAPEFSFLSFSEILF